MKRRSWLLVVSAAAVAGVSVGLSSCARNSEVLADNPELRLTSDREGKLNPFFTPDGNHVIYTSGITGSEAATYQRICMVPAAGGPVRTILADSSAISAVCWLPDEEAILVRKEGMLQKIDLTGKALSERPMDKLTAVFDVAPSGEMLVRKFTGASFDIGLLSWETGQTEILAPTEQWEFQACFGPGDDDITVMAHTEYGEANSSMQVFNRKRGAFTKLPVQEAPLAGPAWSEKGEYLAYSMEGDEATNLWLLESATGRLVQLTTGVEDDMSPSWSPDGEQVAFLRQTTTSHIRIADPVTHEATVISDGEDFDLEPLTSPDGEWISFVRIHNVGHGERMALCVAPTEGGTVRELDLGGLRVAQVGPRGAWSPDATELVFPGVDEEGNIDLFRIPRDGGKPVQVTVGQGTDFLPSWSPDGKHIAFTRILSGESHLWVIPATGGLARQISSGGTYNAHGMWSHDSKQIAYLGIDSDQGYNTWVAEIANPEGRRLVASSPNVVIPVGWVEGGDELVIWRQMDSGVHLCSIRPDGTGERIVADQIKDRNSGMAFVFPEGNDRYSQAFYEGVPYAFAHVERAGDVFVLRVADLIRNADLVAGGAR